MPAVSQPGLFTFEAFTDGGDLLVGGRMYTYTQGTTTQKTAYTDAAGTIAHTYTSDGAGGQYIALNARGELPASLYLTAGAYDIVLKRSDGSTIWTRRADPISAASDLASSDGALGVALVNGAARVVDSITALKALPKTGSSRVIVTGYYAAGDGGGGLYWYDSTDTSSADNGGTIIVATDGARWKLVYVDFVTAQQFGAKADAATNNDTAFANARAFVAANATRVKLVFRSGIYNYSVSPNWAIQDAVIEAEGEVRLRYTGSGNAVIFDAGASVSTIYNVSWLGNFIIEAPSTAGHGYYVRSVHHSKIQGRVAGCGTSSAALKVEFAVTTEFSVRASVNEGAWYSSGKPSLGIHLGKRGAGETTTACTFLNPIIEGVNSHGIQLDDAHNNTFIGGTSEANTGRGIYCASTSQKNKFDGIDLEVNTAGDILDQGLSNEFHSVFSDTTITIDTTAIGCRLNGGQYNSIVDNGKGTEFDGVKYGANGGSISGTGTFRAKRSVYNLTSTVFDPDQNALSLVAPSTSCPNGVATTVLTLPSTGNNMYQVFAWLPNGASASSYGPWAIIFQDVGTSRIVHQVNGSLMTITLSGQNVQVTQSSGSTQNVYAAAKAV